MELRTIYRWRPFIELHSFFVYSLSVAFELDISLTLSLSQTRSRSHFLFLDFFILSPSNSVTIMPDDFDVSSQFKIDLKIFYQKLKQWVDCRFSIHTTIVNINMKTYKRSVTSKWKAFELIEKKKVFALFMLMFLGSFFPWLKIITRQRFRSFIFLSLSLRRSETKICSKHRK